MSEPKLTAKQHKFVAAYLGSARLNATEAARLAGYKGNDRTLASVGSENLAKPEIADAIAAWRAEVRARGIADVEYRLTVLDDLHGRLLDVVAARAKEYADLEADDAAAPALRQIRNLVGHRAAPAGGATGLVVRQTKAVGEQLVEEFAVDNPTIASLVKLHEAAAKELGQRVERHELTGKGGGPIEVRARVDLSGLSDEDLDALEAIRRRLDANEVGE